jgi:hypothetical protein
MMKITRFLLPFVQGVDKFAIEQAILLAKSHQAVLVPLVLIHGAEERRKRVSVLNTCNGQRTCWRR